jgi:antitoxin CptB
MRLWRLNLRAPRGYRDPPGTSGHLALEQIVNEEINALDDRRKRLRFRAWHRGTREMDLVLGRFVDANVTLLNDDEIVLLEALMEVPDPELYLWIAGTADVPANYDSILFRKIVAFHQGRPK